MLAAIATGMGGPDGGGNMGDGHMGYGHMGDGWWWVMGVGWLIFLAAVIAIAITLTRNHRSSGGSRGSAQDTLDDRFARGEIDADEYQKRRDILRG